MLGFAIARRLVAPPASRSFPLRVRASSPGSVTMDATPTTTQPGRWGLFLRDGGHARLIGDPVVHSARVTWRLDAGSDVPRAGSCASWTGIVDPDPPPGAVEERFAGGPAWLVGADLPGAPPRTWAVHLHGLGSTRAGTLRGVEAATDAGLPSVVPSYRNTLEGVRVGAGRSHLGALETADVIDVLAALVAEGAERFVLFGWSLGAQMCLRLAADPVWGRRVDRVVLDSPVLDWRAALAANVARAGLPRGAARLAEPWLERRRRARVLGLQAPLDLDGGDWIARAREIRQPVLIHHGSGDTSVPIGGSSAFVAAAPDARLRPSQGGHTTGWNRDAEAWRRATVEFLGGR